MRAVAVRRRSSLTLCPEGNLLWGQAAQACSQSPRLGEGASGTCPGPERPPPSAFVRWLQPETPGVGVGGGRRGRICRCSVFESAAAGSCWPLAESQNRGRRVSGDRRELFPWLSAKRDAAACPSRDARTRRAPSAHSGSVSCLPACSSLSSSCCSKATSLRQTSALQSL